MRRRVLRAAQPYAAASASDTYAVVLEGVTAHAGPRPPGVGLINALLALGSVIFVLATALWVPAPLAVEAAFIATYAAIHAVAARVIGLRKLLPALLVFAASSAVLLIMPG
jgi:hypothetical protein